MANKEQLEILMEGVDFWNDWRLINQDVDVDLSNADLKGVKFTVLRGANYIGADLRWVNLSGANLSGAYLYKTDLSRTNLSEANLSGANLSEVKLTRANLSGANLYQTDFSGANLFEANFLNAFLREAKLFGASLKGANLSGADLSWAKLNRADLSNTNLSKAKLSCANLAQADLSHANLSGSELNMASFCWAYLFGANLFEADLSGADLMRANVTNANFSGVNLEKANLSSALMVGTNFDKANMTDCIVYGISAWDLNLKNTTQSKLIITQPDQPTITVDNIEVAQFVYLLLKNEKVRHVIDNITSKTVLILGRFTPERKAILDALRDKLHDLDYVSIIFDFDKPSCRNLTETVSTLAHLARFIIADITDAKSIPQELQRIIPNLPSLPVQPIILDSQYEYAMFKDFLDYPWVLMPYRYDSQEQLLDSLEDDVVTPAINKVREVEERRKLIEQEMEK